jgi:aspartyl aminopeptidase
MHNISEDKAAPLIHMDHHEMASWGEFGLSGLVISALFAYLIFLIKEHRAERAEWIQAYRDSIRLSDDRMSETNAVMRELVSVVREQNARRRHTDDS